MRSSFAVGLQMNDLPFLALHMLKKMLEDSVREQYSKDCYYV